MKLDMSRYGSDTADAKPQTEPQAVKASRTAMYGVIPIDAIKTMDKRRFSVIADATLDETIEVIDHLFAAFPLCDTCEEPATRFAACTLEDELDKPIEYACDSCKFSRAARKIRPTSTAEAVHRAKALIAKLNERR